MSLALPFDRAPGLLAEAAIAAYQRFLSPWKGFSCAHRVVHGGDSCSEHVRRVIAADGLLAGLRALRPRLRACREAAEAHRRARLRREFDPEFDLGIGLGADPPPAPKARDLAGACDGGAAGYELLGHGLGALPCDGSHAACDLPDLSGCDASGADCGGCGW